MAVRVKICGVTSPGDARAVVRAGADFVGINFVPSSSRCVGTDEARGIARASDGARVVGVFADADARGVAELVRTVGLDLLQFHGGESPAYCSGWDRPVIKALRAPSRADLEALASTYADVDYLLVDAWIPGSLGGTGRPLDPEAAAGLPRDRLFVAGGLTPERVAAIVQALRPFAVDVASGVESRPGVKDHDAITRFIEQAKAA